jgi:thiol:disulfide interchange protein DsbG
MHELHAFYNEPFTMKKLLALSLSATFMTTAMADTPARPPDVLRMTLKPGVAVVKSFPAAASLTGWVIKPDQAPATIVYTSADGKYLFAGTLLDNAGRDMNRVYADAEIPKVDMATFWPRVEKSAYVVEGPPHPKAVIYAYMDPDCIYCHLLWKGLQPYEKVGLQVRWIPVAILKPDSMGKAAAMLQSRDPAAAMRALQTKYQEATESGGLDPVMATSDTDARIRANGDLMREMGFFGTPGVVYRDPASGHVETRVGMPALSSIAKLVGLPVQPVADRELKQYE